MSSLQNVVLACVDCVDPDLAVAAMRTGDGLPFMQRLLLSDECPDSLPANIDFVETPRIGTVEDYNRFMLHDFHRYVSDRFMEGDVTHVLTLQTDGFILRPELWRDEWLQYDYLGAPWPAGLPWCEFSRVGNSGFCLRSKRLLQATPKLAEDWLRYDPTPGAVDCHDDILTCWHLHGILTEAGMKFAPLEVAARFSFEQPCGDCPQSIGAVFGFHGRLTPETRHMTDCLFRRVNGGELRLIVNYYRDPHYLRRVEIDECLRANCGPGLFDQVLAICKMDTMPAYRRMKLWRLGVDRANFGVHFQAADETTAKADVNVIANADIEFTRV